MYINFIEDRKALGYEVLKDTNCGMNLVSITDSIVLLIKDREVVYGFVRNIPSNVKYKTKSVSVVGGFVCACLFDYAPSSGAMGLPAQSPRLSEPREIAQPSQKHPSKVKIAPIVYNRLNKISLIPTKETIPLIYLNAQDVYINEKVLKKLRAGDLSANLGLIAIGVVVYIMIQLSGVDGFTVLDQIGKQNAPTTNPGFGPTTASTEIALVPTQAQEFIDMSLKFNEPKPNFVMTQNDALKLIEEIYPSQLEITGNERISN